ncbi:hypothetical protein JXA80_04405, partial [bacterium]|nr:hypothetical protein [candidate division CSSED10-310 bacterium]
NHRMVDVRVTAGGLVPVPLRLTRVEQLLEGQSPDDTLFETAARSVVLTPRPDSRASAEYRLDILRTLIVRACTQVAEEYRHEN